MPEFTITLGNKNYSSWSLRGWLALKQTGAAFDEVVIPLDRPDTKAKLLAASGSARVPVLRHGALTVWDSLAIGEYLAELFPEAGLWPAASETRAVARAVAAEMHAGFAALREHLPMDLGGRDPARGREAGAIPAVARDIARVVEIWQDCRTRFGRTGDFLFGGFSLADAAYAPVAGRFVSYGIELPGTAAAYRDAVMAWPAMGEWLAAAREEPWVIDSP
ncbi:MAG: glutathione S-transferase family protein [Rhodospirillales bacterium]|nr:glutathione S-transferase family protein [Rhodospirillales bacterium]